MKLSQDCHFTDPANLIFRNICKGWLDYCQTIEWHDYFNEELKKVIFLDKALNGLTAISAINKETLVHMKKVLFSDLLISMVIPWGLQP